jgi:hypothetical protein
MKQLLLNVLFLSGIFCASAQTTSSNNTSSADKPVQVATTLPTSNLYLNQSFTPSDVIDITATSSQQNGIVAWGSGGPRRIASFVVERSFDGKNFTALQTVAARTSGGNYSFTDAGVWNIAPDRVWYRLQIIDTDGGSIYTPSVELTGKP